MNYSHMLMAFSISICLTSYGMEPGIPSEQLTPQSAASSSASIAAPPITSENLQNATAASTEAPHGKRRDIFFKTVVLIKVGLTNSFADRLPNERHPLLERGYRNKPYTDGNGGLLNPVLKKFEVKSEPIKETDHTGVRIEVSGHVAADGLAPYEFEKIYFGNHNSKTSEFEGKTYRKTNYEMSILEEAILGVLKERAVDRQLSDITKGCFDAFSKKPFAERFISCIKNEWTSKQNEQDTGLRTPAEDELIQRHMARSTFWSSRWNTPSNAPDGLHIRTGEYYRKQFLNGDTDSKASIELTEFELSVKIPGKEPNCQVM